MLSGYDELTVRLLEKRGVRTDEEAEAFLNPSYDKHLIDPLLIKNMPEAARRLAAAITGGERIAVWSDYDCDGIPGGVLLHDFLQKVGANFENYIPHRHDEGYGVNIAGIEELAGNGVRLIVTVDSGITDVAAIARARELGMDVVVTDHHLQNGLLPDGIVVDPNANADETAPFTSWCGAGLAWKLCCAVLAVSPELREKVPIGWEKWLLDMAGLATIADMVPLTGENRLLAKYGLLVMHKSPRIGLQKLCRVARINQSQLTEDDVGFMIAPRVNAASRMDDAWDAFKLFTTTNENEADELAKKLERLNRERKAQAGAITRAVHDRLKERELRSVIALGDPLWRPALLGLVANGIAEQYQRPVFLWGREGNNSIKGSCRAGDATHLGNLMTAAGATFVEFGGHAFSGGFTVADDAVYFLEDKLVEALATLEVQPEEVAQSVDAVVHPDDMTSRFLGVLERLAPFGEGNEKPLFELRDCAIAKSERFGKGNEHVKITIARGFDERDNLEGVAFFAKGKLAAASDALKAGSRAHVTAHLERDQFSRRRMPRLRLVSIVAL